MKGVTLILLGIIIMPLVFANGGANHLDVAAPGVATAGAAISVTVTAHQADSSQDTNYSGTVTFTSSDPSAILPADYTFIPGSGGDNGQKAFSVTLKTAGIQTITATDTATATITGTSGSIAVSPASASTIVVAALLPSVLPGGTSIITATVKDAYNNPIPSISVTFSITSGGGNMAPPSSLTNASGQAQATLTAPLASGTTTVGASVTSPLLSGSVPVTISSGTPATLVVNASPTGVPAGGTSTITATLKDAYNNPVPNMTVNFSVIAGGGIVAPPSSLTNASGQATTVLTTNAIPGTNTVSASIATPSLSGIASVIGQDTIAPTITHTPVTTAVAGFPVTITAIVTDNVGVVSVSFFYRTTGTSIYAQVSMTPTATPSQYQGVIPGSSITAAGVDYYIKAEDAVPNTNYNGTSSVPHVIPVSTSDTIAPVITHTPVTTAVAGAPVTISAIVTDNVGVASVKLFYRKHLTSVYTPVAMTASGSTYTATIPAASVTTVNVDYYIEAQDTVPITSSDGTSIAPHVITVSATDIIPPVIVHTPVTAAVANNGVTISAIVTDNVGVASVKLYYRKTGTTPYSNLVMTASGTTYSATIPASSVTTAGVDYYLEAKDAVPNTTSSPPTPPYVITVSSTDTVPPIIIHTPVITGYANNSIVISATITDNVAVASAKLYFRMSGTTTYSTKTMTASGSTYSTTIPAASVTTAGVDYYIEAKDSSSTPSTHGSATLPHQILITGIPIVGSPPVSLTPSSGTTISNNTPTFSWSAVTGAVSYTLEYASTPTQVTVSTTSYTVPTALSTGSHYWMVRSNYTTGNSAWSSQQTFTVTSSPVPTNYPYSPWYPYISPTPQPTTDKIAPTSKIVAPTNGAKIHGSLLLIKGTASDNTEVKKVEVSTDAGTTWQLATGTTSWSYSWTLPTDGIYVIKSKATDKFNNVEMLGPSVSVTIDNSSPQVTIALTEGMVVSGTSFKISGQASDVSGIRSVEVSLDGGITWMPASGTTEWSYQWNVGPDGKYTIKVRASDTIGNADISSSVTISVDNTLPQVSISLAQGQKIEMANFITITGTADDANGITKVEVSTDGGQTWNVTTGTITWSYEMSFLNPGTYLIKARATDPAGNTGEAEERTITIVEKQKTFLERLLGNWKLLVLIVGGLILGITVVLLVFYFRNR